MSSKLFDEAMKVHIEKFRKKFSLSSLECDEVKRTLKQIPSVEAQTRALLHFRASGKVAPTTIVHRFAKYVKAFPKHLSTEDGDAATAPGEKTIRSSSPPTITSNITVVQHTSSTFPFLNIVNAYNVDEMPKLEMSHVSGQRTEIPVWCLRWTHDAIHGQMVFGSGPLQDSSIYELVHEFLTKRKDPETIAPLKVVLDNGKLFSLSNRRLAALKMFQAMRQHEVVWAPCLLYHACDTTISAEYAAKKTTTIKTGDGLSVRPLGQQEAWHMGKPLFRSKREWCDGSSLRSNSSPAVPTMQRTQAKISQATLVTGGKEPAQLNTPAENKAVVANSEPSNSTARVNSTTAVAADEHQAPTSKETKALSAVTSSQTVEAPENQEPLFTMLLTGTQIKVDFDDKLYLAEVMMASKSKKHAQAPIKVHYHGYSAHFDEWVSVARIRFNLDEPDDELSRVAESLLRNYSGQKMLTSLFAQKMYDVLPDGKAKLKSANGLQGLCDSSHGKFCLSGKHPTRTIALRSNSNANMEFANPGGGTNGSSGSVREADPLEQKPKETSVFLQDVLQDDDSCRSSAASEVSSDPDDEHNAPEYEHARTLELQIEQQKNPSRLQELATLLVFGTFRSVSSMDSQNRETRGEVLVEKGPELILRRRVFVVGDLHRNRAWDGDRCWVRILFVRVSHADNGCTRSAGGQHQQDATNSLFYGCVIRAEESGVPRQKFVVCTRSKTVRSRKFILFKAINGKFPHIRVPWDSEAGLPSSSDLHRIELVKWQGKGLPLGKYVEALNMRSRNSDTSIMQVVQVSLNLCDWEAVTYAATPRTMPALDSFKEHGNVNKIGDVVIGIQHAEYPVDMAISFSSQRACVEVHVVDVNAYLDSADLEGIEMLIRRRSVGMQFMDYSDRPLDASLPLFPPHIERCLDFRSCSKLPCTTFRFPINQKTFEINFGAASHSQTWAGCSNILTYGEAGEFIVHEGMGGQIGVLLRNAFKCVQALEKRLVTDGSPGALEHLRIDFAHSGDAAKSDESGEIAPHLAQRVAAFCSYLVNRYAGSALADPTPWSRLLYSSGDDARVQPLMPLYIRGKPDPLVYNVIERLMVRKCGGRLLVKDVVQALQRIVNQKKMSHKQKHCAQSSFLRRLRGACPYSCYVLGAASNQSLFSTMGLDDLFCHERTFRVASPLQSYIAVLGLRALKCKAGWSPKEKHMKLSMEELAETVARTNARESAAIFGKRIFRQISLMSHLAQGGWRVGDPVVGAVGPSYLNILVPSFAQDVVELRVAVSALRSSTCAIDYVVAEQTLKIACKSNNAPPRQMDFSIRPWSIGDFMCTVTRNFAQPVPHHASGSAVIASDIVFGHSNARLNQITIGLSHRMYPEVFSTWPDLKQWYLIDRDVSTYSQIWSNIRLCQIHAAAAGSHAYTQRMCARRLEWMAPSEHVPIVIGAKMKAKVPVDVFKSVTSWSIIGSVKKGQIVEVSGLPKYESGYAMVPVCPTGAVEEKFLQVQPDHNCYRCVLLDWPVAGRDYWIDKGDLAILSFSEPESVLYGIVTKVYLNTKWLTTQLCQEAQCKSAKCTFAHCDEELESEQVVVEVQLSEISSAALKVQKAVLGACKDGSCDIQFVSVPLAEKKSLDLVNNVARSVGVANHSPIGAFLTVPRTPQQKRKGQEARPLASVAQVENALKNPQFKVLKGMDLNERQLDGLKRGLQRSFSVVQGPPGTGKTTFLMHLVTAVLNLEIDPTCDRSVKNPQRKPGKILVCTPSNQAGDEIVQRLVRDTDIPHHYVTRVYARSIEAAHNCKYRGGALFGTKSDLKFDIKKELEEHSLHFKAQNSGKVRPFQHQLPSDSYDAVAQQRFDKAYEDQELHILQKSRVVVTTCTSALLHTALCKGKLGKSWRPVSFSTVVVDEAAQASEPDVVLPALLAETRVVVVGDHKQLGPVVAETNLCKAYVAALEKPFLERMLEHPDRVQANTMLNLQYRMHPSIRSFPSDHFYDSALQEGMEIQSDPLPRSIWPKRGDHVVWIDCQTCHAFGGNKDGKAMYSPSFDNANTSLRNMGEVDIVVEVCRRLVKHGIDSSKVAVITPYKAQQQKVREKIYGKMEGMSIGTVHALQGSEREYIILSLVRSVSAEESQEFQTVHGEEGADKKTSSVARRLCPSNIGILKDKLLNVSITRAKYGLVLVGNSDVLSKGSEAFHDYSEELKKRGSMLSASEFRVLGRTRRN